MSTEFWINILITVGSLAVMAGGVLARLKALEQKMDKHNNFIERMYQCEGTLRVHTEQIKGLKDKDD